MYVASVLLDIPLRQSYSYLSKEPLTKGQRVEVPFRNQTQIAYVISSIAANDFKDYPLNKLKSIVQVSPEIYNLPADIWDLCNFAANYYHHPLGSTLFCAIPGLLRKLGIPAYETAIDIYYTASQIDIQLRGSKLQRLWQQLCQQPLGVGQIRQIYGANPAALLKKWLNLGLITPIPPPAPHITIGSLKANNEQQEIIDSLTAKLNNFSVNLLYGITGSGKTEVFLQTISKVLESKQQVLVLVPEINLTPQLKGRFQSRFPYAKIALLNSEVSDKERLIAWLDAKQGKANIILGTRLCVFTPCMNLGLVIIDEEHDDSFKQNDSLRYHARDLAIVRAKKLDIPIVLASATPSLETLYNYKLGKYYLYKLSNRANANAALPEIKLVNLQHYPPNHAGISQVAHHELKLCLERKEMALIFINRRGYAPIITCYDCGWISTCRYCSSKMVYHHNKKEICCHHCGYHIKVPSNCPKCHNSYLHTIGHGTQKLEEYLNEEFPNARVKRVDRDTTNSKKAWHELYQHIDSNQIDILVGTQMLAKGHDFANLTLVIGINLDNALYSYDFRASENMYSTLTQVAGRAGRADKKGLVLLQTNYPDHPIYNFLINHDFNGFINFILSERKQNKLPPFSYYALIRISDNSEEKLKLAQKKLRQISNEIEHSGVNLFPPVDAVIAKLHNKYRGQMLLMSLSRQSLHNYLANLEPRLSELQVVVAIDVDPFEL